MNVNEVNSWTSEQLAAQCLFPRLNIKQYFEDEPYRQAVTDLVKAGIGGFCVFEGDELNTPRAVTELQNLCRIPLLFSADFEHGTVMRIAGGTAFPHAMALGKNRKTDSTYQCAKAIAFESKMLGVTWNLAPVCDIYSNIENPIINIRSFGEDAETVNLHSAAYIKGLHYEKVMSCAKHFPGHGDTSKDSHLELPVLDHGLDRLRSVEFLPFVNAVNNNVRSVMTGHLSVPALDESGLPASLSEKMIKGVLREEIGFKGLVITDALDMKAITGNYGEEEAVLMALKAGNNIALLPVNPMEALHHVAKAADGDAELKAHLAASAGLIMKEKKWCGLFLNPYPVQKSEEFYIKHDKIALTAAMNGVKAEGDKTILPLRDDLTLAGFAFVQDNIDAPAQFFKYLSQAVENDCDFGFIDETITEEQADDFLDQVYDADILIFCFFFKGVAYKGSAQLSDKLKKVARKLSREKKTISLFFGNPHIFDTNISDLNLYFFSDTLPSLAASVMMLSGRRDDSDVYNKVLPTESE